MSRKKHNGAVQSRKNCTETAQTKLGKTHVDYWAARLEKRTFIGRNGVRVEIPDYQIRMQHLRHSAYFNLKSANSTEAATKARDIYVFLVANGWEATLAKYKPTPAQDGNGLTIDGFSDHFREARKIVEDPPLKRTGERYIKSLHHICRRVGVDDMSLLTAAKLKEFKAAYFKAGRDKKRDDNSIKISCNSLLRSAAAMFSKQMMEAYSTMKLSIQNPFLGVTLRRVEIKPYTPMNRDLLDSIWEDALKLRDGYPDVPSNNKTSTAEPIMHVSIDDAARWKTPDWRDPHPEAFKILLLELGVGMRRDEADMAQWDWFFTDAKGRRYIEVRKTTFFLPKGKRRRIIPVEAALWDIIQKWRQEGDIFIVPGNMPKIYTPETEPNNIPYRCETHHRTLVAWLRMKGVDDDKPCHLLRKEFGSYIATSFGLFAAQRLLGHSSPTVTDDYYAALVNLPEPNHVKIPIS